MTTQMIIRIDEGVKDRLNRLARLEGKTTSEMVRELIEERIKERDIGAYVDDLWNRIGCQRDAKEAEMKVVIDTNIFVSSFFGGNPKKIIDLWKKKKITLCLSHAVLDEYIDVLQRIGLTDEAELEELLSLFSRGFNILFTAKTPKIKIVKNDPDDDKIIEYAAALKADAVITGDKKVLAVKEYMGIRILTSQQFLEIHDNFEKK